MAPSSPPPIQSKDLTPDDIERGIRKLRRRIEEVKDLDPRTTRYDDAKVESASRNIKADIIDVFGQDSPEYLAHGAHSISYPRGFMSLARTNINGTSFRAYRRLMSAFPLIAASLSA